MNKLTIILMALLPLMSFCTKENNSMTINQSLIDFRIVEKKDLPMLYAWFQEPHVREWWPTPGPQEDFFNTFLDRIRKGTMPYLMILNGKPIGYIQSYIDDINDEWLPRLQLPQKMIGVDQFIGEKDYLHKGYGTLCLKAFINYIIACDATIATIIVDPNPENKAAIRCYEKVGFENLGEFQASWGPVLIMKINPGTFKT